MTGNTIRLSGYTCPDCEGESVYAMGGEAVDEPERLVCLETTCEWEKILGNKTLSSALKKLEKV
jgi:hypothetical protein